MKNIWMLSVLAVIALLSACASGNTYKDASRRIPSLPLQQSRIYFYRSTSTDAKLQPAVTLAGAAIGSAKTTSFFFIDRPPGVYDVVVGDDNEDKLSITLVAGQTRYVRFDTKVGLLSNYLVPIDNNEIDGAQEILPLDYIGPPLPRHKYPRPAP